MGYWTFAKGVQGVFSPGHPPGERVLRDMWEVRWILCAWFLHVCVYV